jgi:hypothetical protein
MRKLIFFTILLAAIHSCSQTRMTENIDKDQLIPVDLNRVKIGGEIGRRIDAQH